LIIADTNVITYLLIEGEMSTAARRLWATDNEWRAPTLWLSEFANVLATYGKANLFTIEQLRETLDVAQDLMRDRDFPVNAMDALGLAVSSNISAYDAQFVVLSEVLELPLVTADKKLVNTFPDTVMDLATFA
jgi:predicted nucleic acid-binding protein